MRSAYVALALRVSKNLALALALALISASAERNVRSVQVEISIEAEMICALFLRANRQSDSSLLSNTIIALKATGVNVASYNTFSQAFMMCFSFVGSRLPFL
jgi:hypothetical protein